MPATGSPPRRSCTLWGVTVCGLMGSLNTISIVALSGTSRFLGGGSVRTTIGGRLTGTTIA